MYDRWISNIEKPSNSYKVFYLHKNLSRIDEISITEAYMRIWHILRINGCTNGKRRIHNGLVMLYDIIYPLRS